MRRPSFAVQLFQVMLFLIHLQDIYDVPNLRFEMQHLKNQGGNLLSSLVTLPQLFQAGGGWSYSSTGFILMGYLLEHVTGLSFDAVMQRSILAPLGMTNTGLDRPRRNPSGCLCRGGGYQCYS
jgi:CubicO group peptidase (beta-lactamase class C family)